ncbi:COG4315 family predicted lipoprotein, partial [Cellulomonas sp. P5_C6]
GVTGEVGTITGTDGKMQVTIDGRPIYTFAQDTAPGDVKGQGLNSVWYVIAPDGTEIDSD